MSKISFLLSFLLLLSACNNGLDVKSNSLTTSPSSLTLDGNGSSAVANSETSLTLTAPTETLWNEVTIDLGADFSPESICSGKTIFGRSGSALCTSSNWTVIPLALDDSNVGTPTGTTFTINAPADTAHNTITLNMGSDFAASNLCVTKSILNLSGTAVCQGASAGTNASAANVLAGTYFWDSTGVSTQGTMPSRDSWDLTTSFPGAGYFSGVANAPASTDIRSGVTILGVSGNTNVVNTSTGDAVAGEIISGKKAWVDGVEVTGTIADRGAVNLNTTAIPGAGFFSSLTLSLTASDICTGKSIFGSAGTAVCNSVFADLMASTMYRNPATTQKTFTTEVSNSSYAPGYRDVPDVMKDDDGYDGSSPVIKALRPTTTCGTTDPTIAARIADCLTKNPSRATWNGATNGTSSEGTWKLVTRTAGKTEVWRDERTGLLWGDNAGPYSWCRASGNAQTAAQDGTGSGICDPADPNGYGAQDASPTSVCAESDSLNPALEGENWTTGVYDATKGGMGLVATGTSPSVKWRIPTINDFKIADANGIRFVLPNIQRYFWSASVYSGSRGNAWFFDGNFGSMYSGNRYSNVAVRCVGRRGV